MKLVEKIKKYTFVYIMPLILISIIVFLLVYTMYTNNKEKEEDYIRKMLPERNITEDGDIVFVAKIKSIHDTPYNNRFYSDSFYIVDYDGHVFDLKFNPELLLLEEDQYIKLYYDIKYYDKNVIMVDDYVMYGVLESEYYGNIYPIIQIKTNDIIGGN